MSAPASPKLEAADYTKEEIDALFKAPATTPILATDEEAFALGLAALRRVQEAQQAGKPFDKAWLGAFEVVEVLGGAQNHVYPMVAILQELHYLITPKVIERARTILMHSTDKGVLQKLNELRGRMDDDPELREEIMALVKPYSDLIEANYGGIDL